MTQEQAEALRLRMKKHVAVLDKFGSEGISTPVTPNEVLAALDRIAELEAEIAALKGAPTPQASDAKSEFCKAIDRLAAGSCKDPSGLTPLGRFAFSTCAASLPIALGVESFVTALEAQKMLDAAIAASTSK